MAMTTCRECGKGVSSEARTCPSCGVKAPARRVKRVSAPVATLAIIGVLAFVGWAAQQRPVQNPAEAGAADSARVALFGAKAACRKAGLAHLRAPATAQWGDDATSYAKETAPGLYHVQLQVDAQNSFGAMLRSTLDCRVRRTGDFFIATSIRSIHP